MRVLLTRPEPQASRTAERLAARGIEAVRAPLLRFRAIDRPPLPPGPFDGLLLTSQNALAGLAARGDLGRLRHLTVFAVGDATARAAREAGFARVESAGGDAADLAALVRRTRAGAGRLLLATGREKAADLAGTLAREGIPVEEAVVYAMEAAGEAPAEMLSAARGRVDATLHYSPRSAEAFAALVIADARLAPLRAVPALALSDAVARPLSAAGIVRVAIAERPSEDPLLDRLVAALAGGGQPPGRA